MKKNTTIILALICVVAVSAGTFWWSNGGDATADESTGIILPTLTTAQMQGKSLFDANCAACHGPNATGSDQGPPLIHIIYEPNHHGDASFYRAAAMGVRGHHWRFGNMPAIEDVAEADVTKIIDYVRALQRANGIE